MGHVNEAATRTPQQERSRATHTALLEAAVACLAEVGWSGSTVAIVAERAGVSRGAAQHHFPTRESLFIAAVDHVAAERRDAVRAFASNQVPGALTTRDVVELVVSLYTGALFRAALELWVASSSETSLREQVVPLETKIGREIHSVTCALLGADESRPGVREAIQVTLDLARGLGLANLLTDDRRRRARVMDQWAAMLDTELQLR